MNGELQGHAHRRDEDDGSYSAELDAHQTHETKEFDHHHSDHDNLGEQQQQRKDMRNVFCQTP